MIRRGLGQSASDFSVPLSTIGPGGSGGVVNTQGTNWLAQFICGNPANAPQVSGYLAALPYCIQYWNEAGFAQPNMPAGVTAPALDSSGNVASPSTAVDQVVADTNAAIQAGQTAFFNTIDTTNQAIGGYDPESGDSDATNSTLIWILVLGGVGILVLEKL
jgi:hypothetical protein